MNNQDSFPDDLTQEQLMSRYLDEHLYCNGLFEKAERTSDMYYQKEGCDIILTSKYFGIEDCIVDEKTQLNYFNMDQATFAFELFYYKPDEYGNRTPHIGWLIDESKNTEAYLLVWPFSSSADKTGKIPNLSYEDIAGIRYLLIKRNRLKRYLQNAGFSDDRLYRDAKRIFYDGNLRGRIFIDFQPDIYYFKTVDPKVKEQPVNIVVKRSILWLLADMKGEIIGNTSAGKLKRYW